MIRIDEAGEQLIRAYVQSEIFLPRPEEIGSEMKFRKTNTGNPKIEHDEQDMSTRFCRCS